MEPDIITARNEVRARLYFHGRVWFCSQGVGFLQFFGGSPFFFLFFSSIFFLLGCTNTTPLLPRWSMRGRYASYWNAFLFCEYGESPLNIPNTTKCRLDMGNSNLIVFIFYCKSLMFNTKPLVTFYVCFPGGVGCVLPGGGVFSGSASGGGVLSGGVLPGGWYPNMHWGRHPSVNRMTDRCKDITLATTSLRPVK